MTFIYHLVFELHVLEGLRLCAFTFTVTVIVTVELVYGKCSKISSTLS